MPDSNGSAPSLDTLYITVNSTYLDRNFYRDATSIFAHLVEVMGGLSLLASTKIKPSVKPQEFVAKALAWWMALCGKVGVRSVENMIWWKFPGVCTYCQLPVHKNDVCQEKKAEPGNPQWDFLEEIGDKQNRPRTLVEWQKMFADIYPVSGTEDYPATFARFTEELGELAEALRVFPIAPGYFLSEAADVFAWLMHLQNLIESKAGVPSSRRGDAFNRIFLELYQNGCKDCGNQVCTCPPILPGTLGRIAHEVPSKRTSFSSGGALLPIDETIKLFELSRRAIKFGNQLYKVDEKVIAEIYVAVKEIKELVIKGQAELGSMPKELLGIFSSIEDLAKAQKLNQKSIDELTHAIAALPSEKRSFAMSVIANTLSAPYSQALLEGIKLAINP